MGKKKRVVHRVPHRSEVEKLLRETERLLGRKKRDLVKPFLIVAAVVLLIIIVLFALPKGEQQVATVTCDTRACFVELADECKPAQFTTKVETATIQLTTSNDCVLTKRIIALDPAELVQVRNLFEGTEMTCTYAQDYFDADYIDMISGNLNQCSGTLVDAVRAVV